LEGIIFKKDGTYIQPTRTDEKEEKVDSLIPYLNKIITIEQGVTFGDFFDYVMQESEQYSIIFHSQLGGFDLTKWTDEWDNPDTTDNELEELTFLEVYWIAETWFDRDELDDYVDIIKPMDQKNLINYLKKADIFVFPSLTEGLPNVVLEAMSMKLPVILTRISGNIELAQNIGSILVDINNSQQLFEAILHYYNNPREIQIGGEINRNYITNTFRWEKHAKELYQTYIFLINKKKII